MIYWIWFSLHLLGVILSIPFAFFVKDPGFNAEMLAAIAFSGNLVGLIFPTVGLVNRFRGAVSTGTIRKGAIFEDDFQSKDRSKRNAFSAIIYLVIVIVVPFITLFNYIDFCQHKNQVVIENTVCQGLIQETDGKDYLNFSIDVSFGKQDVASFDVHTLVFKDNKFIGYISSNFYGTSVRQENNHDIKYFESNTKQTLKFSISHTRGYSWTGQEAFKELYYGDLEEYTFVSNLICVYFNDGTRVGHPALDNWEFYYDEQGQIYFKE